ncbi:MAG TPA: CHC2 zinc finger domain-containing protein [Lacipirellulaceae bacterium]|nr:CHC2 zinc finger domain-containing protein [Lacipirellulaceae bacterium]
MPAEWIDFKRLRQQLKLADVLRHYRIDLRTKGHRAMGLCPLPTHPKRGEGRRTASFSASLDRGLWNCFGCRAGGNALDLAIRMEGKSPDDPDAVRAVALSLVRTFNLDTGGQQPAKASRGSPERRKPKDAASDTPDAAMSKEDPSPLPVIVNAPLDFELKQLDPKHPYLSGRGFLPETVRRFGLGFCSRGLLKDRIAIPLHDAKGRLVGYAGRLVDDAGVDDEHPKYLLPGPRERDRQGHGPARYELHKSELLYNFHRIARPVDRLIVVEGFPSAWWLDQHGYPSAVALMGSSCSDAQASLIAQLLSDIGTLVVLTDGDDAGRSCAGELFVKLGHQRKLHHAKLDDGEQPTDLKGDELAALLDTIIRP